MKLNRYIDWFLFRYQDDVMLRHNARTLFISTILTANFGLGYAVLSNLIDFHVGAWVMISQAIIYYAFPFLFMAGISVILIGNLYILIGLATETIIVWFSGGIYSPVIPWFGSVPMAALLLVNTRSAWLWCLATVTLVLGYGIMALEGYDFPLAYNMEYKDVFFIFCLAGLALILFFIAAIFAHQRKNAQQISDSLLENILPAKTALELKTRGYSNPRLHHQVSVLFADIVGFTSYAEQLSPVELIHELDYCYRAFDEIVKKYTVEKIKVIGDAYMCASGVPNSNENHHLDIVCVALEMQAFMEQLKADRQKNNKPFFELRIGIHSGSVVSGIVGTHKFSYDIWGDTVNIASRMESSGEKGRINISETTYQLVQEFTDCEFRGQLEAKNKGKMHMYFLSPNADQISELLRQKDDHPIKPDSRQFMFWN